MVNFKAIILVASMTVGLLLLLAGTAVREWATADEIVVPNNSTTPQPKDKQPAVATLGLYGYCLNYPKGAPSRCFRFEPDCKIYDDSGNLAEKPFPDGKDWIIGKQCNNIRGMEGFSVLSIIFAFIGIICAIVFLCKQAKCSSQASASFLIIGSLFGLFATALFADAKENARGPIFDDEQYGNGWVYGFSLPGFTVGWLITLICGIVMICLSRKQSDEPTEEF